MHKKVTEKQKKKESRTRGATTVDRTNRRQISNKHNADDIIYRPREKRTKSFCPSCRYPSAGSHSANRKRNKNSSAAGLNTRLHWHSQGCAKQTHTHTHTRKSFKLPALKRKSSRAGMSEGAKRKHAACCTTATFWRAPSSSARPAKPINMPLLHRATPLSLCNCLLMVQ